RHDRHEARLHQVRGPRRQSEKSRTGLAAPREHLLRANLPAPSHLADRGARRKRLGDNPPLLRCRPATASARPRQNLDPTIAAVRVSVDVIHSDSLKPSCTVPTTFRPSTEERPRRPAYGYSWFCDLYREWVGRLKP